MGNSITTHSKDSNIHLQESRMVEALLPDMVTNPNIKEKCHAEISVLIIYGETMI